MPAPATKTLSGGDDIVVDDAGEKKWMIKPLPIASVLMIYARAPTDDFEGVGSIHVVVHGELQSGHHFIKYILQHLAR